MPAAAIPAAIGVAGSVIGGLAGVGKDKTPRSNFGQSEQYDPNAFQYAGKSTGADEAANYYSQQAEAAQQRAAPTLDYAQANAARAQQDQAAGLMMARANGQTPSIAGMQAADDARRAMAAQASMAASARGAGGLALANQAAASNTANAQAQISQQAQINAANERLAAEQAAFGAYGNMRGQDAQQTQFGGQLALQQRGMNDQYASGLMQNAMDVRRMQLEAQMRRQGILAGSFDNQQGLEARRRADNAAVDRKYLEAGVSSAQSAFQTPGMGGMGGAKK